MALKAFLMLWKVWRLLRHENDRIIKAGVLASGLDPDAPFFSPPNTDRRPSISSTSW